MIIEPNPDDPPTLDARRPQNGKYWYSRPSWNQRVPVTVTDSYVRFSPVHYPTRMQDIPDDAIFEPMEVINDTSL